MSDGVYSKDKKERRERITLTEPPTMVNGRVGNAIKDHLDQDEVGADDQDDA
jgi:hypothetical protein